jgi:hypothetical protein
MEKGDHFFGTSARVARHFFRYVVFHVFLFLESATERRA